MNSKNWIVLAYGYAYTHFTFPRNLHFNLIYLTLSNQINVDAVRDNYVCPMYQVSQEIITEWLYHNTVLWYYYRESLLKYAIFTNKIAACSFSRFMLFIFIVPN